MTLIPLKLRESLGRHNFELNYVFLFNIVKCLNRLHVNVELGWLSEIKGEAKKTSYKFILLYSLENFIALLRRKG